MANFLKTNSNVNTDFIALLQASCSHLRCLWKKLTSLHPFYPKFTSFHILSISIPKSITVC